MGYTIFRHTHLAGFGWVWLDLGMLDSALNIDEPFKEPFIYSNRFGFRYGNSMKFNEIHRAGALQEDRNSMKLTGSRRGCLTWPVECVLSESSSRKRKLMNFHQLAQSATGRASATWRYDAIWGYHRCWWLSQNHTEAIQLVVLSLNMNWSWSGALERCTVNYRNIWVMPIPLKSYWRWIRAFQNVPNQWPSDTLTIPSPEPAIPARGSASTGCLGILGSEMRSALPLYSIGRWMSKRKQLQLLPRRTWYLLHQDTSPI